LTFSRFALSSSLTKQTLAPILIARIFKGSSIEFSTVTVVTGHPGLVRKSRKVYAQPLGHDSAAHTEGAHQRSVPLKLARCLRLEPALPLGVQQVLHQHCRHAVGMLDWVADRRGDEPRRRGWFCATGGRKI